MRRLEVPELAGMMREIKLYGDTLPENHTGHYKPEDLVWYFMEYMPVADIALGTTESWTTWMKREMEGAAKEGVPDRYCRFLESDPQEWEPIVCVEGRDGRFYVWVGHHRVGAAVMRSLPTLQAIVGLRRPQS